MAFSTPRRVVLGLQSPSRRVCADGLTDGRTDGHVTITSQPKFLGSIGRFKRCDFPYNSSMQLAHVMSATRIVSSKSGVRHLYDMCTQHEKCRRILKLVLKPYDSRSHNQNVGMTSCLRVVYDLCLTQAARATKVAYDSRKQKSHRLNRPIGYQICLAMELRWRALHAGSAKKKQFYC